MKNRTIFAGFVLLLLFSACSRTPKLKIEGTVVNAEGKMLYLELFGMNKTEILDSAKLKEKGTFHFKIKLPDAPEFYRLRIGDRYIQLGADSAGTVVIEAEGKNFGQNYTVEGSRCCELIRELTILQAGTLKSIDSLSAIYKNKQITDTAFQKKVDVVIDLHRKAAGKVIYENPRSAAAYFALFQRLKDYLIFDPFNTNDNKYYAAVATSWKELYPNSVRGKNLVNLTLQGLKQIRMTRDRKDIVVREQDKISYFEVTLPDIYGRDISLSSLKGKVILLDFTVYQSESSSSRNLKFRDLYNKYNKQGFEIFQVSLDSDENLWKTSASNLPWICVHDRRSLQSGYLSVYNVQNLPTYFIMDREGNLVARDAMISDLNKEILKLL